MEKERSTRIIAIVALLIAVFGVSIGFAAYSASLNISNTSATVGASSADDFKVVFSNNQDSDNVSIDTLISNATATGATAVKGTGALMNSTTITGLSANFTDQNQKVEYTLYARNTGKFDAYLNNVTIGSVAQKCVASTGTTQSLVDNVCDSITMTVKVGTEAATEVSVSNISNHLLGKGLYEPITITLEYAENEFAVDGDFTVNFGQITLGYDYVD